MRWGLWRESLLVELQLEKVVEFKDRFMLHPRPLLEWGHPRWL